MRRANIKGALVGVEAVTPEGLKDVFKGFNDVGEALVERLRTFREHGVHVLGSFIFGLPSDRPSTFDATADVADRAGLTFAQFVMLTPYPGTVDFAAWEKRLGAEAPRIDDIPITRHWLIPQAPTPQDLLAASRDDVGGDSRAYPGRVGSVLQPAAGLGTIAVHDDAEGAARLRADLEAVPPDVRQHRDCHRQRPRQPRQPVGAPARQAVPASVHVTSAA